MVVRDVMKSGPAACTPDADLATVAQMMRDRDCGFLPVVESHGVVVGVITDRDVCMAAVTTFRLPSRISAAETMSRPVFCCFSDDDLKTVLARMATHHVRRLPVLDKQGHLQGVISVVDIARAPRRRGDPTSDDVVLAMKAICGRRPRALFA